jgi:uncharacterized MAPEG superfamily protein
LSAFLWAAHVLVQSGALLSYLVSSREVPTEPKGVLAKRALANYLENFTAFVALDLAFIVRHQSDGIGPVWIVARILYLPLSLFKVIYVRSLAWGVSLVAIVLIRWRAAASAQARSAQGPYWGGADCGDLLGKIDVSALDRNIHGWRQSGV